ncbi:arsenate reductase ArsC [Nocardia uniformis]|uniref:Arsenate reductase ArsC n=1 Tax=Nocardia uniformis TaxID=53432 RepID=A0A849C9E1_9NOCA|nr:phosphotyrosine protein phosphatase [Nocardia uniformis]NNH75202.1 arsenate reductase ArsC [Nocardia uniformis]
MTEGLDDALVGVRHTVSVDQRVAIERSAVRLAEEFAGVFEFDTVQRFLISSYDQLAVTAKVPNYLPLLAERFTRQRLRARAKAEGRADSRIPAVLFLCSHNAGRSQMALGFFADIVGDLAVGWSGGSAPDAAIDPRVIDAMAERGVDITTEFPKPWTDEVVQAADVVVDMGCGDTRPARSGHRYEVWDLADPAGQSIDRIRAIRDEIEQRVRLLVADLDLSGHH